jgi:hypothetical protein
MIATWKNVTLAALVTAVLAIPSHAQLRITEVMSSSAHGGGTNNEDWFELTNTGAGALSLVGFSWDDNSNTPGSAFLGGITSIAAGQSIIFTGEPLGGEASWISNWGLSGVTVVNLGGTGFQNFGAGGDALNIYDSGNALVTSVTFGTATSGFSFEWDTNGVSLGLSAIGQNGAFQAVDNGSGGPGVDVGSPGTAVPEPSTWALLILGCLGAFVLHRKKTASAVAR